MKSFIITALAFVLVATSAMAQGNNRGRQRMNSAEMYANMGENLAKELKIEKDQREAFKLLYVDYQNARRAAQNPTGSDEEINVKKMTDEEANKLIQEQFASQEKVIAVDKEYLTKFLEICTPVQAAQVFVTRLSMQNMMRGMGGGNFGGMGGGFGGGGFGGGGGFAGGGGFGGGGFGGGGF